MRSTADGVKVLSPILVWDSFILKGFPLTRGLTAACWFAGENFSWKNRTSSSIRSLWL